MKLLFGLNVVVALMVFSGSADAQTGVGINTNGTAPDSSAILDVSSTTRGLLIPRMTTTERNDIANICSCIPAEGLMIFNTTTKCFEAYVNNGWYSISCPYNCQAPSAPGAITGNNSPCENESGVSYSVAAVSGAVSYTWTVPSGASVVSGQGTTSVMVDFGTTSGNVCVSANNLCGSSSGSCMAISLQAAPAAPSQGTHTPSQTQIVWNWNTVPGATGYKWNTVNDFGTATDMGALTTNTETGLSCNTSYTRYVWAYNLCSNSLVTALNSTTSACGAPDACLGQPTMTDSRNGKVYNIIGIANQCWMAQGLDIGTRISTGTAQSNNGVIEKYCYNNLDANCTTYGGLYQWAETVQYLNGATNSTSWSPVPSGNIQGLCPAGWHLPSENELLELRDSLGGYSVAGGYLKEAGTANWDSPNTGADNSSGFTGLGTGNISGGTSTQFRINTAFWSSTESNPSGARFRLLTYTSANFWAGDAGKSYGYNIRCLKD